MKQATIAPLGRPPRRVPESAMLATIALLGLPAVKVLGGAIVATTIAPLGRPPRRGLG